MSSDVAVLCKFKSADENLKMFFPGWESSTNCLIRDTSGSWDLGLMLQLATAIAACFAVVVAVWATRVTLNRDLKSRAINAHEHWTEKFFLLDIETDLSYEERKDLVQDLKTRMGSYKIHLNLVHKSIPTPLGDLASDIRKVFEIGARVWHFDIKDHLTKEELNSWSNFLGQEGIRRKYRNHVSECANHLSELFAGESQEKQCLERLIAQKATFDADFKTLLDLHPKLPYM